MKLIYVIRIYYGTFGIKHKVVVYTAHLEGKSDEFRYITASAEKSFAEYLIILH